MTSTLTAEQIGKRAERAEDFLSRRGYRHCDIAACNCGSWHGGNAEDRLQEIRQIFSAEGIGNGKILTQVAQELIERAERAEAEVASLLARLKSTESALDRAVARSNGWREEAAELQTQVLAERQCRALPDLESNDPQVIERNRQFRENIETFLAVGGQPPADMPRTCETCRFNVDICGYSAPTGLCGWSPKIDNLNIPEDGELTMGDG